MRLTLRTLLAYMDDMLDPSDQEELGRKIEASPFATELIHRSRDAVRRLRLSAPEPLAGDSGDLHGGDRNLDANTAAEYLDSILSPDDVAEFERSCLEAGPNADMLLAEAVSCHHILTLVLGEPAEVDGDLRQRMYEIVKHSEPAAAMQVRIEPAHRTPELEKAATPPQGMRRPKTDPDGSAVPDYMREAARIRRGEKRRIASLIGAACLGGFLAYLFFSRPGEPVTPKEVAKMGGEEAATSGVDVGESANVEAAATGDIAATADPESVAPPFDPSAATLVVPPAVEPAAAEDSTATAGTVGEEDAAAAVDAAASDAAPPSPTPTDAPFGDLGAEAAAPVAGATTPIDFEPVMPDADATADASGAPVAATADTAASPTLPGATEPTTALPSATLNLPAADAPPVDAVPPAPTGVDEALDAAVGGVATAENADAAAVEAVARAGAADAEAEATDQPRQLGAYLGNQDLLLRFVDGSGWLRLPPRSMLASGDRLMVLPNFRTHVVLGQDVNAFIGGGTEVSVLTAAEAAGAGGADFGLAIPYGRVILNSGASGNRIALVLGDETRVITLGPSSSLAIDVERGFVPGVDPSRETYPLAVTYFLTTGRAEWGDGAMGQMAEGEATWSTVDGEDVPPQSIEELPAWVNAEQLTGLEQSARDVVEDALAAGQPVAISLLELTDPARRGKRIEVRGLAGKSAAYIGEFEPLVNSLSDMNERPRWKERVESLRQAVARDPESLDVIAKSFAVQHGEKAVNDLVEMLLGFNSDDVGTTKEELANGSLVRLITWLDDEDLSYRVLASYNVNEITGTTSLGGYRPEHLAQKRRGEIKFYWDRLEKGDLTPRQWTAAGWAGR